jgi:probable HAF family extracellular repeat protein
MQNLGTLGGDGAGLMAFPPTAAVVVGWAYNAARQYRAFRWTASGGMEDLNTTYASLLTPGSYLGKRYRHLPRWALYCGRGQERRAL